MPPFEEYFNDGFHTDIIVSTVSVLNVHTFGQAMFHVCHYQSLSFSFSFLLSLPLSLSLSVFLSLSVSVCLSVCLSVSFGVVVNHHHKVS